MKDPKQSHLFATKRILRYLKGTSDYGVLFPKKRTNAELSCLDTQILIGVEIR